MVAFRLYRAAFLPALAALVVLLFSLEGIPPALAPSGAPIAFSGRVAAQTARAIVRRAPSRPPGSEGDNAIADLVARRFADIRGGRVAEQGFSASCGEDDASLRNVILTIPGAGSGVIAVLAARDAAHGPGAVSSASATAALLEAASQLAATSHSDTLVLASTDGGACGAAGARELASYLRSVGPLEAAIAISQPAAAEPRGSPLVATSTSDSSTSIQLLTTAERAVREQEGRSPGQPGPLAQLALLAIPSGLGEQAPLIGDGLSGLRMTSAGERPLPAAEDGPGDISALTLGRVGAATMATVLALDAAPGIAERGPGAYVAAGGSLVPGWALALLALALIAPACLAAADALARARRRGAAAGAAVAGAASLALIPLASLFTLYALGLAGVVPRPPFPSDPAGLAVGPWEVVAMLAILAPAGWAAHRLRARRARAPERQAALPAAGLVASAGTLIVWLSNPFLALLLAPLAHAWLALTPARRWHRAAAALAGLLAALPALAAAAYVASRLGMGVAAPWQFLLMTADWQVPPLTALGLALVAASVLALISAPGSAAAKNRSATLDAMPIGLGTPGDDIGDENNPHGGEEEAALASRGRRSRSQRPR